MQHAFARDHDVRILEQLLRALERPEVPLAAAEDDRHDVDRDVIDQAEAEAEAEDLAAGVARRHADVSAVGLWGPVVRSPGSVGELEGWRLRNTSGISGVVTKNDAK